MYCGYARYPRPAETRYRPGPQIRIGADRVLDEDRDVRFLERVGYFLYEERIGGSPCPHPYEIKACRKHGLDMTGRSVASRVANLAWATTSAARVTSADALGGLPPRDMLKVGITAQPVEQQDGTPIIELGDGVGFSKRLGIAVASTGQDERRVIVQVPASGVSDDGSPVSDERWNQHLAVLLLDAFCSALR